MLGCQADTFCVWRCWHLNFLYTLDVSILNFGVLAYYSQTSLARPPLARQTRVLPWQGLGRISCHAFYPDKLPLAPAMTWRHLTLCNSTSITRHNACCPVLAILAARRDGRLGTTTAAADDSSHPSPPLQGNQRSA